jgi:predicted RNA-binding Zn-ribbon protein involved in translation (DUF1610 family)/uncharacterized membrane protein
MAIEFHCTNCNKLLRTSDDRAGARAKCPDCGTEITVPRAGVATGPGAYPPDSASPYSQPGSAKNTKNCPMCGAEIAAAAVKCRFCGEMLGERHAAGGASAYPTKFEAGEVISTSWEIFQSQMGLLIGGTLLFMVIFLAAYVLMYLLFGAAVFGLVAPMRGRPAVPAILLLGFGFAVAMTLMISYFQAGYNRFLLNVARGTNPQIGDFFSGGPYYLRFLGNGILFIIMVYIGIALCVIPGIIVMLMFWPFQFVIVDETSPQQGALSRAKDLTDGNWGATFLLWLAALGINLLGALACGIGQIFTAPLTSLMFAVAYCRMTGHPTAAERMG